MCIYVYVSIRYKTNAINNKKKKEKLLDITI